jgi:hypothetical protein
MNRSHILVGTMAGMLDLKEELKVADEILGLFRRGRCI